MTSQYQLDGQNLNHGFLGCCIAGESVCLVIDILYIALQQFEPLHLKGFSVPKIYLLAAKGGQDRRDEFFHNRKVEHEDALHDAELLAWMVDIGTSG